MKTFNLGDFLIKGDEGEGWKCPANSIDCVVGFFMNLGDLRLGQWDCLVAEDLGMGMLPVVLALLIGSLDLLGRCELD